MGQKNNIDLLPEELRKKVLAMLDDPSVTQAAIVEIVNAEAGRQVLTGSSMSRFAKRLRKERKTENATSAEKSLIRIADALERIAVLLEKSQK